MTDDWDTDAGATKPVSAPAEWGEPQQNKGFRPGGVGRGRGAPATARLPTTNDWDAAPQAAGGVAPTPSVAAWDSSFQSHSGEWGGKPAQSQVVGVGVTPSNDAWNDMSTGFKEALKACDEEPRGGGWGNNGGGWAPANTGGGANGGGRACFKCKQEGHMSRDCPNAAAGGGGSRACYKCNQEGHMSRDCPNAAAGGGGGSKACFKCQQEGHMSRDCPNAPAGGGNRACYKCNQEGHMSRDCPNAPAGGGGGGSRACYRCQQEGHTTKDCPNPDTRTCKKCGEAGHMSRDCPNGGGDGDRPPRACFKCHSTEHMSKDCTQPVSDLTADGKPREQYIPVEISDENELFHSGITTGSNFQNYDKVAIQVTGHNVPAQMSSFENSGLRELVLRNIKNSGYVKPTPVQKAAIPAVLARRDLIACAATGSGKSAAYLVPIINILLEKGVPGGSYGEVQKPEAVIIAPTRELAIQIQTEARKFAHNSCLKTVIVYGGTVSGHQRSQVQNGCNILVGTPGRLKDFIDRGLFDFSNVEFLVLDEADRMLDMGFKDAIEEIARSRSMPPAGKRRTMMFSATFPSDVQQIAFNHLVDYVFVTIGTLGGTNPDVQQLFYEVQRNEKRTKLQEVLNDVGDARVIVFVESKKTADFIAAFLCNTEFKATSIHGDRLQSQREQALRDFKTSNRNILVATNVAARGLDIAGVEYVINYDLPSDMEEYVHRIGRTGRVGNIGKSISFFDPERDGDKAGKLVEKLVASNADVPTFLQSAVSGVGGMGYNYNAPSSQGGFGSVDVRRFGQKDSGYQAEAEAGWD